MRPLTVDYLGHASLVLHMDGLRVLTDPALRARIGPLRRTVAEPTHRRLDGIDAVLVSHLHWDHLDLPSLARVRNGVRIVVPSGAGDWLRGRGFDGVVEVSAGDLVTLGGITVEAVPARHGGMRPPLGPTAEALGYVLHGSRSVYFAGDTDLFAGMRDLAGRVDLALLPVWGWGPTLGRRGRHLDPVRAARALQLISPRAAMPIHWGTYWPQALGRVRSDRRVLPPKEFTLAAHELQPATRILAADAGDGIELV